MRYEARILWLGVLAALPGGLAAGALVWSGDRPLVLRLALTAAIVAVVAGLALDLRRQAVRPVQTIANLLSALREGDFSVRGRGARSDDAMGLAILEANALAGMLREQRLAVLEATALLRKVLAELDVAVFAFDGELRLRLVNRAGERLLGRPDVSLVGRTARELSMDGYLEGEPVRIVETRFPGGSGRWELRRGTFRESGFSHQLLVLSDLSRLLAEEERQAWQRLVRVLSHEINNSLAPIHSIAGTLLGLLDRDPRPEGWETDFRDGLEVVSSRSAALARFMAAYARLARLPPPRPEPMDVPAWIHRVAALETRLPVRIRPGPALRVTADEDQLDQLLINLVRNAADAALERGGGVEVGWEARDGRLEVRVDDEGPGLTETANLFVPFFTTRPHGSGIGLALSRQIAEAHGGSVSLANREDGPGCRARLVLPLASSLTPASAAG